MTGRRPGSVGAPLTWCCVNENNVSMFRRSLSLTMTTVAPESKSSDDFTIVKQSCCVISWLSQHRFG